MGRSARAGGLTFLRQLTDPGSIELWSFPDELLGLSESYGRGLAQVQSRTGVGESIISGRATISGHQIAAVVSEFAFMGGSIGLSATSTIVAAVRRATEERLPLVLSPSSGGTRMQEGVRAFVGMREIAAAVQDHRAAGLLVTSYLRHPTFGGAFASWGSSGHLTLAAPGAMVGFLGPKIFQSLHGRRFPDGVQTAENLFSHGIVDGIVASEDLGAVLGRLLDVVIGGFAPSPPPDAFDSEPGASVQGSAPVRSEAVVEALNRTASPGWCGVEDVLSMDGGAIRLSGTGRGELARGMITALTRIGGVPCVVAGHARTADGSGPMTTPEDLRAAIRAMDLADELRLPLVTLVDTPGGELSPRAEQSALAGEIARCLARSSALRVPHVSVLLGRGCGGAALALVGTGPVLATRSAWLSPLPIEGASAILFDDTTRAAEVSLLQGVTAPMLLDSGVVHEVLPESQQPQAFDTAHMVSTAVGRALRNHGQAGGFHVERWEPGATAGR